MTYETWIRDFLVEFVDVGERAKARLALTAFVTLVIAISKKGGAK